MIDNQLLFDRISSVAAEAVVLLRSHYGRQGLGYCKEYDTYNAIEPSIMQLFHTGLSGLGLEIYDEESLKLIEPNDVFLKPQWLCIDPLDGTWNYSNQIQDYGLSIALMSHKEPIWGLIYDASSDITIRSDEIRDLRLHQISDNMAERPLTIFTGSPYGSLNLVDYKRLSEKKFKARMIGSAVVSMSRVLQKKGDLYCELGIFLYDVAAAIAIAKAAGLHVKWSYIEGCFPRVNCCISHTKNGLTLLE